MKVLKTDYYDFCQKVDSFLNINLLHYKENQMKRRLMSLYEKKGYKDFQEYFLAIKTNEKIRSEFLDRITINVSEFFRNGARWEVLEKEILPSLVKGKSKIKVWSAACSTGEEAYTLVMVLSNFFDLRNIQIIATDIDDMVLQKARTGKYNEFSVKECPPRYLQKFFVKKDNDYYVSDEVKRCVTFKKQDLLKDKYDTMHDLIVCRNVMIYFTEDAKEELYYKFSDALKSGGVLFVGSTEQIFQPQKFSLATENTFFYKKI